MGKSVSQPPQQPVIVFADDCLVIVNKPPGWTTTRDRAEAAEFGVRGQRFLTATLSDRLPALLKQEGFPKPTRILPVHRLDRDTSGLVAFALNAKSEVAVSRQLREHTAGRVYLAIVRGAPPQGRIVSYIARDRGDKRRGSTSNPRNGQLAVTHVTIRERAGDYSLVECRLETGRTHQVRIHLGEAGTPICGERVYDRSINGQPIPDTSGAHRVALHAHKLSLVHPESSRRLEWKAPLPVDLQELLEHLRTSADAVAAST